MDCGSIMRGFESHHPPHSSPRDSSRERERRRSYYLLDEEKRFIMTADISPAYQCDIGVQRLASLPSKQMVGVRVPYVAPKTLTAIKWTVNPVP